MRIHKMLMLAGLAVAAAGGAAAADPYCHHPQQAAAQPAYGAYADSSSPRYDDDDYDRRTDEQPRYQSSSYVRLTTPPDSGYGGYDAYDNEPAPGTYQNGYVWVAGAYGWVNGATVWIAGHWQLVDRGASYYRRPAASAYRVRVQPRVIVQPSWSFSARF